MYKYCICVLAALSMITACNTPAANTPKQDILLTDRDSAAKPGDDFFAYANGGWIKKNPIPGDETAFGIGELVQRELYVKLQKINEDAEKAGAKSGPSQRIGDFWYSAMDTASI